MSDSPSLVLRTHGLGVALGAREVLRDVRLEVAAGERVAVLGPSGAGKSVLLAAVLDALPPHAARAGTVEVTRRTAWVQQDPALALHPSVRVARQLGRAAGAARVAVVLEEVGLDPGRVLPALPSRLSGGERQRVCLALAILADAELLLADEPTTALDTVSQAQVLEAVRRVPGAVVLVTHDVAVAAASCTRALVVADGTVVEEGPMDRLLSDPRHPVTAELVRLAPGRAGAA